MASSLKDADWLQWIERTAGKAERDTKPSRSLFYCRLDDQPDHLVPARHLATMPAAALSAETLALHPECVFTSSGQVPARIATSGLSFASFALDSEVVWLPEAATGGLTPFWVGAEIGRWLTRLCAGKITARERPEAAIEVLAAAGVLTSPERTARQRQEWQSASARAREEFARHGYSAVGGLIHPFHLSALRRYYRFLIRTGALDLGDDQSSRRFVAHNEGIARFFHRQLTAAVAAVAGEPVKPAYAYLASYQPGAVLERHTDRAQCEFSITLCVDYAPEPQLATPWPIILQTRTGTVTFFQGIGDALFYRGCEIPHERHALPPGHASTSIFFHYVPESFSGSLD